jgi:hypothetical protein
VTHQVPIDECMRLLQKMARESRARHSVGRETVLTPYMEQDHGIKIVYDPMAMFKPIDAPSKSYIEFASEAQYTFLLLKYS